MQLPPSNEVHLLLTDRALLDDDRLAFDSPRLEDTRDCVSKWLAQTLEKRYVEQPLPAAQDFFLRQFCSGGLSATPHSACIWLLGARPPRFSLRRCSSYCFRIRIIAANIHVVITCVRWHLETFDRDSCSCHHGLKIVTSSQACLLFKALTLKRTICSGLLRSSWLFYGCSHRLLLHVRTSRFVRNNRGRSGRSQNSLTGCKRIIDSH